MFKNFLRTLVLLTFLISTGEVIGSAPGLEDWKDDAGRPAPASVKQAADTLWTAVKLEGKAAFNDGLGITVETAPSCCSRILCCLTCGLTSYIDAMVWKPNFGEVAYNHHYKKPGAQTMYDKRQEEVRVALQNFRDTVNGAVSRPEKYSRDIRICELGPWIEDGAWYEDHQPLQKFTSIRHDLSSVLQSTKTFVKAHGGWTSEGDIKKGIVVLVDKRSG